MINMFCQLYDQYLVTLNLWKDHLFVPSPLKTTATVSWKTQRNHLFTDFHNVAKNKALRQIIHHWIWGCTKSNIRVNYEISRRQSMWKEKCEIIQISVSAKSKRKNIQMRKIKSSPKFSYFMQPEYAIYTNMVLFKPLSWHPYRIQISWVQNLSVSVQFQSCCRILPSYVPLLRRLPG